MGVVDLGMKQYNWPKAFQLLKAVNNSNGTNRAERKKAYQNFMLNNPEPTEESDPILMSAIFVKDSLSRRSYFVKEDEFIAIEGRGDYLLVHTTLSDKPFLVLSTMAEYHEYVSRFKTIIQVQKSFVINLHHLLLVEGASVVMTNQLTIPVSNNYGFWNWMGEMELSKETIPAPIGKETAEKLAEIKACKDGYKPSIGESGQIGFLRKKGLIKKVGGLWYPV